MITTVNDHDKLAKDIEGKNYLVEIPKLVLVVI